MKVTLCDICNKPIEQVSYQIKIKRKEYSWYESWWNKLDVCSKCGDSLFLLVNDVRLKEDVKKIQETEYNKIIHLLKAGAVHDIDTGRLDGKCEDVIPLEDAIAIIDKVYKAESENKE